MDFKAVIVILVTYFIRPQDWVPGMSGANIVKPLMAWAILAMVTRQRGFTVASMFRTPMDWMMLFYGVYIVYTAPDGFETFKGVFTLIAFYYVTCQALRTRRQIAIYLNWWFACLMIVAAMAVLSEYGFDVTNARDLTHVIPEKPRLVLNTYLFNNPNSLGHTIVLAIPLAYFLLIWKRNLARRIAGIACIALAAYCVFLTQSKGSYIAGFAVFVGALVVGRAPIFQLMILLLAATMGWAAISQLPRMTELSKARGDEAILGRLLAWEMARTASLETPTGKGWKEFQAVIEFEGEEVVKATHSSYVLIGAELGRFGMFFFVAVLYSGGRMVFLMRPNFTSEDRSRRALAALLLGFVISGWMIDRSYHLEYFIMAAAIAALHRKIGMEDGAYEAAPAMDGGDQSDADDVADEKGDDDDDDDEKEEDDDDDEGEDGDELGRFGRMDARFGVDAGPANVESLADWKRACDAAGGPGGKREGSVEAAGGGDPWREKAGVEWVNRGELIRGIEDVDLSALTGEIVEEELERYRFWRRFGIMDAAWCVVITVAVFELWDYIILNF